jgi:hypothetical protein
MKFGIALRLYAIALVGLGAVPASAIVEQRIPLTTSQEAPENLLRIITPDFCVVMPPSLSC